MIPSKVAFFTWLVGRGRCLTLDLYKSKRWELANRCIFARKKSRLIISLCIVMWLRVFGCIFLTSFGFIGSCPLIRIIYSPSGGLKQLERKKGGMGYDTPGFTLVYLEGANTIDLNSLFSETLFWRYRSYTNDHSMAFVSFIDFLSL